MRPAQCTDLPGDVMYRQNMYASPRGYTYPVQGWPSGAATYADDAIDYLATLSGVRLELGAPATFPVSPPLDVTGVALPLKIAIGDVGGRQAGTYSDVITIDISSR